LIIGWVLIQEPPVGLYSARNASVRGRLHPPFPVEGATQAPYDKPAGGPAGLLGVPSMIVRKLTMG